jgi:uncharacterized protein YozE (UPF0346 family)
MHNFSPAEIRSLAGGVDAPSPRCRGVPTVADLVLFLIARSKEQRLTTREVRQRLGVLQKAGLVPDRIDVEEVLLSLQKARRVVMFLRGARRPFWWTAKPSDLEAAFPAYCRDCGVYAVEPGQPCLCDPEGEVCPDCGSYGLEPGEDCLCRPSVAKAEAVAAGGFYRWLTKQKGRDDSIGDIARDARLDPDFPRRIRSGGALCDYLQNRGACMAAIEAADRAWGEYAELREAAR